VVLGDGEERQSLVHLAGRLGIAADVAFMGFVANPFAWMARARVFVLGSRFEGFSNVLAEALAVGCTIVSTDCPHGPRELLDEGRHGRLVPVGDASAMAAAMLAALDDPADPGRQRARAARFSVGRAVDGYLEVLTAVAAPDRHLRRAG
ncbi:MAG: glycosyltransferase, partial [Geminicoccaceae bacterium]|nr:glycosyltransferase [Geminicoccaceae bacterium]